MDDSKFTNSNNAMETDLPAKRQRTSSLKCLLNTPEPKKSRVRKPKKKEDEFETIWICSECKEAECSMDLDSDFVICDGICKRIFHFHCAGLTKLPDESEEFVCQDCQRKSHACCICSNYGVDGLDVFKCLKSNCGLFFHESCLNMRNIAYEELQVDETTTIPKFVCPAHTCWTCTETEVQEHEAATPVENQKKKKGRKKKQKPNNKVFESKPDAFLTRCIQCPIAYHVSCIPPTARFHELATLCHEHSETCKLPDLDLRDSVQGRIEAAIDEKLNLLETKLRKQALGENVFFPGVSGSELPKNDQTLLEAMQRHSITDAKGTSPDRLFFCLPCDLKTEVHSKPPNYRHVNALQYNEQKPPKKETKTGLCGCLDICDEHCMNRACYIECTGDPNVNKKFSNCSVGPNCTNRQIGQRRSAKCKPLREQGKGWGLVVINSVKRGDLVQEYVGEVIDGRTKEQRLIEWTAEHPNDPNFYVMALQTGWFIDARNEANLSRFINHSCDPNCSLLQINVNGRTRCGIFAKRDIEAGEFLSYDYQFETRHGDHFVCCCGAKNCRGTLQGGSNLNSGTKKKSNKEIWEEAKAIYERDKKFVIEYFDSQEKRASQVDALVPGADPGSKDEYVANGPQSKMREKAISNRIFLWRNARDGANFAKRFARLGIEEGSA